MTERIDVLVGTLGRPHGLRGEVTVRVSTDEPDNRFAPGAVLRVQGRERAVASSRWHSGTLLVSFVGVTDRTVAESLRGAEVWASVAADEAPAEEGEFWDRQLVGLAVRNADGEQVGSVGAVLHLPAHDVLSVHTASGERLVPFVTALVPVVDVDAGFIQVAEVGGLLVDEEEG